jgi:prepilin-type processing-associated H-X9-DG protein
LHGGHVPVDRRPLNKYAPAAAVFHCPADKGDSLWKAEFPAGIKTCFDGWGNSYLAVWGWDTLRVHHVTGNSIIAQNDKKDPKGIPIKLGEIAKSPSNKLIEGDWLWWSGRDKADPWSQWHNFKGQYRMNMLYGDGHVDYFNFPKEMYGWGYDASPKPDSNYKWW